MWKLIATGFSTLLAIGLAGLFQEPPPPPGEGPPPPKAKTKKGAGRRVAQDLRTFAARPL